MARKRLASLVLEGRQERGRDMYREEVKSLVFKGVEERVGKCSLTRLQGVMWACAFCAETT